MNDGTIAFRAKEQLGKFLGKAFTHFSKPKQKFLADMLYGIQASGDTMLSSVVRAINDDPDMGHAVEKRPSRNVADEKEPHVVVARGFGSEPMMILASLPVNGPFESMRKVVEGCLTRWRTEETIRFVKQAFTKFGRWCRRVFDSKPDPSPAEMLPCLPGMEGFFLPDVL